MTLSTIHCIVIRRFSARLLLKPPQRYECAVTASASRGESGARVRHFLLVGAAAAVLSMAPGPAFAQHGGGHATGGGFGGGGHASGGGFGGGHANASSHGGGATHSGGRGVAEGGRAGGSAANSARSGESGRSAASPNGGGHWWSGIFGGGHSNSNNGRGATNANAANARSARGAWASSNVNVAEAARENAARKSARHANAAPSVAFYQKGVRLTVPAGVNSLHAGAAVFATPLRSGAGTAMAPAQNNPQINRGLITRPGGLNGAGGLALRPGISMAAAPRGHLHPPGYFYDPYYYNPFFYSGFGNCYYGYCGGAFGAGWGWGFGFGAGYYGFGGSYWNAACDPVWGCQGFGYNGWGYDNSTNTNNTANGSGDYTIDAGGQSQESNPGAYVNPPADMNGDAQAGVDATGANAGASVSANADSSANGANSTTPGAATAANAAAPNSGGQLFVLYMKDGSSYAVSDYWLGGGKLHYVTSYGGENTVDLAQLDVQKTVDVNAAAGRKFSLRAGPAN